MEEKLDEKKNNPNRESKYDALKNELMHAMYRFKSVGRRSHGLGLGHMHGRHHHGHDPHERGDCHGDNNRIQGINTAELIFMKQILARESSDDCSGAWLSSMSDHLHVSKAAVSQMIGSLERKGFVTRETNPGNRREIIVSLTKEGEKRVNDIQNLFDEKMDMVIDRFGVEDTKELIRLIDKLADIIGGVSE